MPNIRIITPNDGDSATLSVSPAVVSTLREQNLQSVERARIMRTTSTAAQTILGTWSGAKVISAVALTRHNLTSSATWRLKLYSDSAWTSLVYDSGEVIAVMPKALGDLEWGVDELGASLFSDWDHAFSVMWIDPVTAGSFRLILTDASNPDGYFQASRLFIGRYLEPSLPFTYGTIECAWVDDSTQERTDGGTLRTDESEPYRRMSWSLDWLSVVDRPRFMEWARRDGKRSDVFVSAYPEQANALERDHSMAAKLIEAPRISQNYPDNFAADFVVEEA